MKQRSYIIKGVILTLLVTLLNFTPVYASNDVAKLSLHAFGNSLLLNSNGKTQGHAFLTIKNISRKTLYFNDYPIKPSHTLSVSIWPDSTNDTFKYGGVYINRELFVDKDIETYSISQNISAESLEKIEAATPSESYYHDGSTDCLWHNCTTYSLKMWNAVVSKDYRISAKTVLFADAPKKLVKEIRKKSNYQKKTFIQDKPIYTTDVFHINKNKDLVPVVIKAPTLHSSRVSNNSVKLSWTSSKKMYHNQTNVTAYLVKYNTTSNPNDSQELYVKDGFHTTVKNLKSNTSYKFTVTALYSKGNYRVQISDSNTLVITTKSANTYETELSEVLNETASEASKQLGLNKPFSSGRTVYYTKHGSTKDRTCFITCSFDNLNQKRKWSFYAFDDSISVYGAKIGMTENSAKQKLLKNKWKVFTRYYNKATDSGFIIYKRGTYSMHVSQKHNKLNQISFFNNEGLYYS